MCASIRKSYLLIPAGRSLEAAPPRQNKGRLVKTKLVTRFKDFVSLVDRRDVRVAGRTLTSGPLSEILSWHLGLMKATIMCWSWPSPLAIRAVRRMLRSTLATLPSRQCGNISRIREKLARLISLFALATGTVELGKAKRQLRRADALQSAILDRDT